MSLSFGKQIAYAAPAFALAVVGIPVYVYIPKFYTDVVGVHIGLIGYLLMAARVFDAVTDPALGFVSDRTKTRFGRRRPYIAIGSVFLAISLYLLFNPPRESATLDTLWFGFAIFFLFLFWTAVVVPFESLGPELTFDYHERTALFGMRDGAMLAGTLAAASSPLLVATVLGLPASPDGERLKFFWISVIYSPFLVLCCWWCALSLSERPLAVHSKKPHFLTGFKTVMGNKPFALLVSSYTIAAFGSNLPATLILYYVEYVLKSQQAELFLAVYFVTGIVFLPGWVLLSRKLGKKWTWIASIAVNTGAFIGVFFLGAGDAWLYGLLVFLSGIGLGATIALPSAMQADVIDYDELLTGERREGRYIGFWSIAKKLAAALGVGISLSVLAAVGYVPNVEQTEAVKMTLRVLYALVPSLFNLIALIIVLFYPISSSMHERILAAVKERKAGRPVQDPLRPERTLGAFGDPEAF